MRLGLCFFYYHNWMGYSRIAQWYDSGLATVRTLVPVTMDFHNEYELLTLVS